MGASSRTGLHTALELYNPRRNIKVSADASSHGLGAVLLQATSNGDTWKPVAYAFRSTTDTEKRYAQIEKDALAATWACEKFSDYVPGQNFHTETDHKPLVPLLTTKHLDSLFPRIVRFRLRLARYDYTISHVPGKLLYTAGTLSRAPLPTTVHPDSLQEEVEVFVESLVSNLSTTEDRLQGNGEAQADDFKEVMQFCKEGWPNRCRANTYLIPYMRV